ncbi:MAG: carbohydrate kinase family protein [Ruminococcaceae bacterium]|nr:carbohydrate kinase family protein [Oscillospiraceae bacterium]
MKKYDVLSVGDINVEITMTNLSSMPVLGREVLADGLLTTLGGSTVNTAVGLAVQGLSSAFVGKLGQDDNADFLRRELAAYGVDGSHLAVDEKEPTGVTVSLSTAGDRAMVTCMGAIGTLSDADVSDELLGQSRHLHVGGYFLQPALRPGLPVLFDRAHAAGLTTSFDTGWDDSEAWGGNLREVLAKTDVFLPNESEALAITGEQDVPAAARALARIVKVAVVKWGKRGACVCTGDTFIQLPAYRGKPVDTTGAGDAFNAGFLSAFVRGLSLDDCLRWGLASGSISVTRLGSAASCPNRADIEAMIASNDVEA